MKEIFLSLQYDKIELKNKYLIQTKSIPQFIEIIENSKIFDLIKDKKSDNDIINSQNYYNLKKIITSIIMKIMILYFLIVIMIVKNFLKRKMIQIMNLLL